MSIRLLLVSLMSVVLVACVGSVSKTNQLSLGMTPTEVRAVLGEPSQTLFVSDKWVWKYSLHEPWKGFIPYYMVFNRDSRYLEQWYADEAEYTRQQLLWLQAMQARAAQDAAAAAARRASKPLNCTSRQIGNTVHTNCY